MPRPINPGGSENPSPSQSSSPSSPLLLGFTQDRTPAFADALETSFHSIMASPPSIEIELNSESMPDKVPFKSSSSIKRKYTHELQSQNSLLPGAAVDRPHSDPEQDRVRRKCHPSASHITNPPCNLNSGDFSSSSDKSTNSNRYDGSSEDPFDVYVQPAAGAPVLPLYPVTIGGLISASTREDIAEIKKIGFSRIAVCLKTHEAANELVSNPIFATKNLTAFIPSFRISRSGIIRNVPLEITEKELIEVIQSASKVVAATRLNRRISVNTEQDASGKSNCYVPTRSLKIIFKGQTLPNYIYVYKVRYEVTPFVSRVLTCFTCLRFGHTSSQCKGHPRCFHCAGTRHVPGEPCPMADLPPTCANYKRIHKFNDPTCPERGVQQRIRELAASQNLSLAEARDMITHNRSDRPRFTDEHRPSQNVNSSPFPSLSTSVRPVRDPDCPSSSSTVYFPFPRFGPSYAEISKQPSRIRDRPSQLTLEKPNRNKNSATLPCTSSQITSPRTREKTYPYPPYSRWPPTDYFVAPNGRHRNSSFSSSVSSLHSPTVARPPHTPSSATPGEHPPQDSHPLSFSLTPQLINSILTIIEKVSLFLKMLGIYEEITNFLQSLEASNFLDTTLRNDSAQ